MSKPLVFISYSHEDEAEKNEIIKHLSVLHADFDFWVDDHIPGGGKWEEEIQIAINKSDMGVFLVSANSLISKFILSKEIPSLLRQNENEGRYFYPIIIKSCAWKKVKWLSEFNVRPKNGDPVFRDNGRFADDELAKITEEIANLLEKKSRTKNDHLNSTDTLIATDVETGGRKLMNFVNRTDEVKHLTKTIEHTLTPYFLIHAPAGYGKSVLLEHVKERLESEWLCAKAIIQEGEGYASAIEQLRKEMQLDELNVKIKNWGYRLAAAWNKKYQNQDNKTLKDKKGIVLLFDFERRPNEQVYSWLITTFVPGFQKSLEEYQSFKRDDFSLRVVMATRSTHSFSREKDLGYHLMPLSPFDYRVVFESISFAFQDKTLQHRKDLAATFLCYSGGHPGCIAELVELYKETDIPLSEFLLDEASAIRQIVEDANEEMSEDHSNLPDIILNQLSVFRWFNRNILEKLIALEVYKKALGEALKNSDQKIRDAYDLEEYLTSHTSLFVREGDLLKDSISRQIRMILLEDTPDNYYDYCQKASDWCLNLARMGKERATHFAVEFLYVSLLKERSTATCSGVVKLRDAFLGHENDLNENSILDQCIIALLESHDKRSHAGVLRNLKGVIEQEEQWELRFLTNHLLRDEHYTDEPVGLMYKKLDQLIQAARS